MPSDANLPVGPDEPVRAFYMRVLDALQKADAPFLVGGAYALRHYSGVERDTKDFDIFVRREDYDSVMAVLDASGCATELTFPHWLGKATCEHALVDVIFSSGNGIALVDADWFKYSTPGHVFDVPVNLCPPEEMIWSKAFVTERERYDGADIMHLLLACAEVLDWDRLLKRFDVHWRVLFAYLCLFGFVYPSERTRIPAWVMTALMERMEEEMNAPPPDARVCQGTLISREQYLPDVEQWGFEDARLTMANAMTQEEIAQWTRAIKEKE
jgi:Aminoglycoside-2''-adenylyltransferase